MSTALARSRYDAVMPLPIVVSHPPENNLIGGGEGFASDEQEFNWWRNGTMEWTEFDYIELPPDAAAAVVGLDRKALRQLERDFEVKLSDSQLADVLGFAKLVDTVRLASNRKARELCLAYLEKAHGRRYTRGLFEGKGLLDEDHFRVSQFMRLCAIGRLGIVYPKDSDLPQVAIAVPNLVEGLKLQIVLSLQQSRASAHCENCGNAYIRHTKEQRFCSERCASRERQARYRANKLKGGNRRPEVKK